MRLLALRCLAALTALASPAAAQMGVLDQDNTATTNVVDALGFAPFVYEQVVEVGVTGTLEGFVIRITEFNAPSPTLPVAVYAWDAQTGLNGSQLWSGNVPPPTLPFFTFTFVDTSAAALNFDVGDFLLIQVGDAVIDLSGWDLTLNEGFDQSLGTFVALYPHELFTDGNSEPFKRLVFQTWMTDAPIGTSYCNANANSTGAIGTMFATGTATVALDDLELVAQSLPTTSFGYFILSRARGFVPGPNGSQGNLCLSGAIGRFVGPGQIQNSGNSGTIRLQLDLLQFPTPTGFVSVLPGETWDFQAWHRDSVGGVPTSNFTDAVEVVFQ